MGNELSSPVEKIVQAAEGTSGGEEMAAAMFCISGCKSKFRDMVKSCTSDDGYASGRRPTPACCRAEAALHGCLQAHFDFYKASDARDRAIYTKTNFFSSSFS